MACDDCAAFREELRKERAKPSVEELLGIASTSAQIACLNQKAFPMGSKVTDEASSVALRALKQVLRERMREGAEDGNAGSRQEG